MEQKQSFDTRFTNGETAAMCDGLVSYKKDVELVIKSGTLDQANAKKAAESLELIDSAKRKLERRASDFILNEFKVIYFGLDNLKDGKTVEVVTACQKIEAFFKAYDVDIRATCAKFKLVPQH